MIGYTSKLNSRLLQRSFNISGNIISTSILNRDIIRSPHTRQLRRDARAITDSHRADIILMARIVTRIAELADELVSVVLDIEVTMAKQAIKILSGSEQKIAQARYINGLSWSEVSKKTNFSVSHCRNTIWR
jgi:hypothetical protein